MSLLKKLSLGVGLDLNQVDRDLEALARRLDSAGKSATVAPAIGGGNGGGAEAIGIDPAAIGDELRAAILSARPLSALGTDLGAEIDRVGGTIVTGFRRIDEYIKFPGINRALKATGEALSGFAGNAVNAFKNAGDLALGFSRNTSTGVPILDQISGAAHGAQAAIAAMLDPSNTLIQKWTWLRERVEKTRAEMALASNTGPSARNRPGSGRALKLQGVDVGGLANRALVTLFEQATKLEINLREMGFTAKTVGIAFWNAFTLPLRPIAAVGGALVEAYRKSWVFRGAISSLGDVSKRTFGELFSSAKRAAVGLVSPTAGVKQLGGAAAAAGTGFLALGRNILAAFGFVGIIYQAVGFLRSGVKAASDLNETVAAGKEVFGASFGSLEKQASGLEKAFGVNKNEFLNSANAFGSIAQGAGLAESESAKFAGTMGQLAADLASFKNLEFAEAAQKLQSGLAGETEPLRQFGVVINEDAVQAKALALGLGQVERSGKRSKVALDDEAKFRARAALITEKLAAANGDLARTQDGAANQFRKAGGGLEAFGRTLGEILLPAVNLGTNVFNDFLGVVLDLTEQSRGTFESWVAAVGGGIQWVGRVVRNHAAYWEIAKLKVGQWGAYVVDWLGLLPTNFGIVTKYLRENWFDLLVDLGNATAAFFTNLLDNAANAAQALWDALAGNNGPGFVWKSLTDGFEATAEKFPGLMKPAWLDIKSDVDKLFAEIDGRESKLKKAVAAPAPVKKAEAEQKKQADDLEHKLAKGAEVNSREAYSAVAKNAVGDRQGSGGIKDVAKVARDQLAVQRDLLAEFRRRPGQAGPALQVMGL